jgi:hypothetical protein
MQPNEAKRLDAIDLDRIALDSGHDVRTVKRVIAGLAPENRRSTATIRRTVAKHLATKVLECAGGDKEAARRLIARMLSITETINGGGTFDVMDDDGHIIGYRDKSGFHPKGRS